MFTSTRRATLSNLIRTARMHIKDEQPIPLTIYAALDQAGVDINELERTTRNGR
jgi:hypothetical protein